MRGAEKKNGQRKVCGMNRMIKIHIRESQDKGHELQQLTSKINEKKRNEWVLNNKSED